MGCLAKTVRSEVGGVIPKHEVSPYREVVPFSQSVVRDVRDVSCVTCRACDVARDRSIGRESLGRRIVILSHV